MNLIILTDKDSIGDNQYELTDNRAEHIRTILKLESGDKVDVGILNGPIGTARIEILGDNKVTLICNKLKKPEAIQPDITLICALPRPQTLKKVLITSAMMGVKNIHLIRANRVEKSYFQSPLLEPDNMLPYLIEGLSQGKLTRLPEVVIHSRFKPFFEDTLPKIEIENAIKIVPEPEAEVSLDKVYDSTINNIYLAIGPEGGWVPFEIEMMEGRGFKRFKLSRSILRVETALTASLAQIELIYMK